jgi:endonuclease G
MVNQTALQNFKALVNETTSERAEVRNLIHQGKWRQAEPDDTRRVRFRVKEKILQKRDGKESLIGDTLDWLDVCFFTEGNSIKRAVGYVTALSDRETTTGSGFMISDTLFITNNHVIIDKETARRSTVTFEKENDENGKAVATTVFRLNPDKFFLKSLQEELDYTIVAIGSREFGELNIGDLGYFILSDAPDKHVLGMNVNIIQHPLDLPKKVSLRNNALVYRTDNSLLYETDTETCSSGSPVCNDYWDLVAIHHWGEPYKSKRDNPDSDLPNYVNEGIRISSIYKDLSKKLDSLVEGEKDLLLDALSYAKLQPSIFKKRPSKVPSTAEEVTKKESYTISENEFATIQGSNNTHNMEKANGELKLTIPIEITIKLGNSQLVTQQVNDQASTNEEGTSVRAEANKIDTDYSNRSGYDVNFIPGFIIPIPEVKNRSEIAPLKNTEPDAEEGILSYEHFALILSKKNRAAFFTATNIDGETYKRINRETGEVVSRREMNEEEGESWYKDPRIDEKYHLNQPFFSEWSHLFDRGHLTRRTDPSWGSKKIALRADADTFHFSNCSIQHFRFNQTLPYWQGVERYILEHGLLETGINCRLIVFQGPVYEASIDLWADDFQIPSRYFKIAVWKSAQHLKAVGLVVDQGSLLDEERKNLGKPRPSNGVSVLEWRVPIKDIEKLTKLDFGETVRNADTIGQIDQPHIGAEAFIKIPVKSWEDLLQ